MFKNGDVIAHINENGLVELVDVVSGEIVAMQRSPLDVLNEAKYSKITKEDGSVLYLENGIDASMVPSRSKWQYSAVLGQIIAEEVAKGMSFRKIADMKGMPPYWVMRHWRSTVEAFREILAGAYMDRAELRADEALELADTVSEDQDAINKAKLQVEVRKWIASKDNPAKYGQKVEIAQTNKVMITIDTGIRRPGDPGYKVDETAKITEAHETIEAQKVEDDNK